MNPIQLARWQWAGYPRYHRSRANLVLHIIVVPMFVAANVVAAIALLHGWWPTLAGCLAAMVASVALQGRGHADEGVSPEPFTGPLNAIARIFLEQWVTFPGFVMTGAWWAALRVASKAP